MNERRKVGSSPAKPVVTGAPVRRTPAATPTPAPARTSPVGRKPAPAPTAAPVRRTQAPATNAAPARRAPAEKPATVAPARRTAPPAAPATKRAPAKRTAPAPQADAEPMTTKNEGEQYFKDKYGGVHGPQVVTFTGDAVYVNLAEPNDYEGKKTFGLYVRIPKEANDRYSEEFLIAQDAVIDGVTAKAKLICAEHRMAKKFDPGNWLKDGDDKLNSQGEVRPEFDGYLFVSCNNEKPIATVDRLKKPIDPSMIEAGMKVRVVGRLVASTPSNVPKVSIKPTLVQLVEDDGFRLQSFNPVEALDDLEDLPPMDVLDDEVATDDTEYYEEDGQEEYEDGEYIEGDEAGDFAEEEEYADDTIDNV